jgi:hypothetical protein
VVNGCTHCTPENTHWTPGIIASNGCAGATPAHPAQTSGAHDSGAYPRRDAPAPQELPRAQGGLQPAPSPVSGIRTPKRPLLPVWEKGVGGMRGQTHTGMPAHPAQTSGAHASGAYPGRDAPAPQELPRAQGGFSPHPLLFQASGRPNAPFSPRGRRGSGG